MTHGYVDVEGIYHEQVHAPTANSFVDFFTDAGGVHPIAGSKGYKAGRGSAGGAESGGGSKMSHGEGVTSHVKRDDESGVHEVHVSDTTHGDRQVGAITKEPGGFQATYFSPNKKGQAQKPAKSMHSSIEDAQKAVGDQYSKDTALFGDQDYQEKTDRFDAAKKKWGPKVAAAYSTQELKSAQETLARPLDHPTTTSKDRAEAKNVLMGRKRETRDSFTDPYTAKK